MIEVGQIYQDNDPRMTRRKVRIVAVEEHVARYVDIHGSMMRVFRAGKRRFYQDGKPRRSGFSLIAA